MDFKVKIKPKIKYKKISADTLPKPSDWYCNICKKKYAKGGKYQHLKTDFSSVVNGVKRTTLFFTHLRVKISH